MKIKYVIFTFIVSACFSTAVYSGEYTRSQINLMLNGALIEAKGIKCRTRDTGYNIGQAIPYFKIRFQEGGQMNIQSQCDNGDRIDFFDSTGSWRLDSNSICLLSDDIPLNQNLPEIDWNCLRIVDGRFGFDFESSWGTKVFSFKIIEHPKYSTKKEIEEALASVSNQTLSPSSSSTNYSADADKGLWEEIRYSSRISDFQRYLSEYPNGMYVHLAENQIRDLVSGQTTSPALDTDALGIEFGNYHALVIGINKYRHLTPLKTAVDDANAISKILRDNYGFKVQMLIDPERTEIIDAFDEYRETLTSNDNLLIYYAGHGWLDEDAEVGYWLTVNSKPNRRSHWISNATITHTLKTLPAKHVMVIADSCYAGTLTRSMDLKLRDRDYLKRMASKKARVALVSGGLEPVADDGGTGNSPFARALITALKNNGGIIDGTRLFSEIRRPVILNAHQTPQYSDVRNADHDGGDFLFVRKH